MYVMKLVKMCNLRRHCLGFGWCYPEVSTTEIFYGIFGIGVTFLTTQPVVDKNDFVFTLH